MLRFTAASTACHSTRRTSHVKGFKKKKLLLVVLLEYTMMPSADR